MLLTEFLVYWFGGSTILMTLLALLMAMLGELNRESIGDITTSDLVKMWIVLFILPFATMYCIVWIVTEEDRTL